MNPFQFSFAFSLLLTLSLSLPFSASLPLSVSLSMPFASYSVRLISTCNSLECQVSVGLAFLSGCLCRIVVLILCMQDVPAAGTLTNTHTHTHGHTNKHREGEKSGPLHVAHLSQLATLIHSEIGNFVFIQR